MTHLMESRFNSEGLSKTC